MATYRVQHDDGIKTYEEAKLRKKLRSKDLTGLELVRREDDGDWTPLCETALFRDEVPYRGHPMDAARQREVQGFVGHVTGWVITAGIMAALGSWFPFWIWIWGVFVVVHGAKVAPSALALWGAGQRLGGPPPRGLPEPGGARREVLGPGASPGSPLLREGHRVRALLHERGDAELAQRIDELMDTLTEVERRRADLEAQLSPGELRELEAAREQTTERLRDVDTEQDRHLLRAELEAIDQRREAVTHAQRTLERLQSRERAAAHQLKQLRLDLSQAEVSRFDIPDFADRVEALRLQAAAAEEVEETLAASRPKA